MISKSLKLNWYVSAICHLIYLRWWLSVLTKLAPSLITILNVISTEVKALIITRRNMIKSQIKTFLKDSTKKRASERVFSYGEARKHKAFLFLSIFILLRPDWLHHVENLITTKKIKTSPNFKINGENKWNTLRNENEKCQGRIKALFQGQRKVHA